MREDFDLLLAELAKVALRIFQSGKRLGKEQERARLLGAIQAGAAPKAMGYGDVAGSVLQALRDLVPEFPNGATAEDIIKRLKICGFPRTGGQVRAAIKYCATHGRVWRPSHGRYLPCDIPAPSAESSPPTEPMKLHERSNTDRIKQ